MTKLLDCTLRDGGYVNNWEFGYDNIINIYERLVSAQIDIIEIGFIDERCTYDINRSMFPDTISVKRTFGGLDKGNSLIVGMIDYGTCSIEKIEYQKDNMAKYLKNYVYQAIRYCPRESL